MHKSSIEEQIREIAERVAAENDLEFVHSEVVGAKRNPTVRVFIDKAGGVTHEDCSVVSRRIEALMDADDFIPSAYLLEVSSPGLERELYSLRDFERYGGHLARIKTSRPVNGQKNFRGRIVGVENAEVIFDDKTSGAIRLAYDAVAKANLEIDLEEELKNSGKR